MPYGSRSPWTTRTGTGTPSSSGRRLGDVARPGGCSGKARQTTPTAPAGPAVRQATRAPDERPPKISGRSPSAPARRPSTIASQAASSWAAGGVERFPATR